MKDFTILMKLNIETNNDINIDDINEFANELVGTIKDESTKKINILSVDIEEVEDLNDDLYDFDEDE